MIVGIVPIYKPNSNELKNIEKYIKDIDYCYLLDDTGYSNYDTCKELIDKYSNIEYVCNTKNIGLCASVNNGFHLAVEKGADWILVMNPDGTFQNDALKIYKEYIRSVDTSNVAIVAPRYNIDRHPRKSIKRVKSIKYADMTGCLYNVSILERLGYYDLNTYFYSLDVEYCIRVLRNNYKIIECSEAVLNHHPAETKKLMLGKIVLFQYGKDSPLRYYYQFRSGYYIFKKYHDIRNFFVMVYKYMKIILFFDNKKEYFKMIKYSKIDERRGFYGKFEER